MPLIPIYCVVSTTGSVSLLNFISKGFANIQEWHFQICNRAKLDNIQSV